MSRDIRGFSMIELITVVGIVSLLAALAITQFSEYRKRGFDARTSSDLRNAALAEEAYFTSNEHFLSCISASDCESKLGGFRTSPGVVISVAAEANSFTGSAYHSQGNRNGANPMYWNSANGGLCQGSGPC